MESHLPQISDDLACEIATLATNMGNKEEHAVIDRIYGICVGLYGKKNDMMTVELSVKDESVVIMRYDRTQTRKIRRIFNKGIIKQKLSDIGIIDVAYNPH